MSLRSKDISLENKVKDTRSSSSIILAIYPLWQLYFKIPIRVKKRSTADTAFLARFTLILSVSPEYTENASAPGFLRRFVTINEEVNRGQLLGEVINPYNGEILSEIRSTADGIIFYDEDQPTILENASAFQVIKKLHE